MILPKDIAFGQLERTYGMGFMRLMLPSPLVYNGRNSAVASGVNMPPVGCPNQHTLALSHNGENVGALSNLVIFPEYDAAVVVLGNTTALGDANELVAHLLASEIVGDSSTIDYQDLAIQVAKECRSWHERTITNPLAQHRVDGTTSGKLTDYVGLYQGASSGFIITVTEGDSGLFLCFGGLESQQIALNHYHYDTFSFATSSYDEHMSLGMVDFDDWKMMLISFDRDEYGHVAAIKWRPDARIAAMVFNACFVED